MASLARMEFERKVNDFARSVQKAFWEADRAMRCCMDTLEKQYIALIKELSEARKEKALIAAQDRLLDESRCRACHLSIS